jgi:hypothetical protein
LASSSGKFRGLAPGACQSLLDRETSALEELRRNQTKYAIFGYNDTL